MNTKYVEELGEYFQDHDLIQGEKHSIQLITDPQLPENSGFVLNMILNKEYKQLPSEMIDDLLLLEDDIRQEVFNGINFRIEVCDDNFVPLNR